MYAGSSADPKALLQTHRPGSVVRWSYMSASTSVPKSNVIFKVRRNPSGSLRKVDVNFSESSPPYRSENLLSTLFPALGGFPPLFARTRVHRRVHGTVPQLSRISLFRILLPQLLFLLSGEPLKHHSHY